MRFGRFELRPHERRLLCDGEPVAVGARAFDLLLVMATRPDRLLRKSELLDLAWPGQVVQENNLAAQVSALRKVLGDGVIATIPGRGYRFVAPWWPADTAPHQPESAPRVATAAPTRLPATLAPLIGRDREGAQLAALVDRHRLVTVVGAGGVGKSLLAMHLLQARRGAYPQGVCWVELADQGDAQALAGAVAAALGVHLGGGGTLDALCAAVAPLSMLLALDNAEHRLAEVAGLADALHRAAPGLHLLVTSQAALRLAAEQVFRVGPLAVPQGPMPAAEALRHGAVALFAGRAQAADFRFELADADVPAVLEICLALDGLPLALELAAARVPLLGVAGVRERLHARLELLSAGRNRLAPARQRTLRATLEWSHDLLGTGEQRVFRRLSVFAGSAALDSVQAVAGGADGLDDWAVLDALEALVERSFAARLDGPAGGAPRVRLLESPRTLARERLEASGERAALLQLHAEVMAARLDAAYAGYFDGRTGSETWAAALAPDLDNARAAIAWARGTGQVLVEARSAATLLRALPESLHGERMALAEAAVRLAGHAALPDALRWRLWIELSTAWSDNHKPRSRDAARQATGLARRLDADGADRFVLYRSLCRLAGAEAQAGDLAAAQRPLDEARSIEDARWPAVRLLWGVEARQVLARLRGDAAGALALMHRLAALDRERGGDATIVSGNLIDAQLAAGDTEGAAASGASLVARLEGQRDEFTLGYARLNLAAARLALGEAAAARGVLQPAWPQARAFDLQHAAAAYLALLAALEGRPGVAALLLGFAEAGYDIRGEAPEVNEAGALARVRDCVDAAPERQRLARLRAEGRTLADDEVAALAFADRDTPER